MAQEIEVDEVPRDDAGKCVECGSAEDEYHDDDCPYAYEDEEDDEDFDELLVDGLDESDDGDDFEDGDEEEDDEDD